MAPASAGTLWPWQLTPLTARTVASWLIAFGIAAALAIQERDLGRLELPAAAYAAEVLVRSRSGSSAHTIAIVDAMPDCTAMDAYWTICAAVEP